MGNFYLWIYLLHNYFIRTTDAATAKWWITMPRTESSDQVTIKERIYDPDVLPESAYVISVHPEKHKYAPEAEV